MLRLEDRNGLAVLASLKPRWTKMRANRGGIFKAFDKLETTTLSASSKIQRFSIRSPSLAPLAEKDHGRGNEDCGIDARDEADHKGEGKGANDPSTQHQQGHKDQQ